jgi:hypothetical protein
MRLTVVSSVVVLAWAAQARGDLPGASGKTQASAAPTRALVCNEVRAPFRLALDEQPYFQVAPQSCVVLPMSPGPHILTARGRPDAGPWFSHPAWRVDVPAEGAVLRFRLRGDVVTLAETLKGFPASGGAAAEGAPTAGDPPALEQDDDLIYVGRASEFPSNASNAPYSEAPTAVGSWWMCGADVPLRVSVDFAPSFMLGAGVCSTVLMPFGFHSFGFYGMDGTAYCPPYSGFVGPGGGRVRITPSGAVRERGGWRVLPPSRTLVRTRVPRLTPANARTRGMSRDDARRSRARAAAAARQNRGTRGAASSWNRRAPAWRSNARAWAAHRARQNGWVVGPRNRRLAWQQPRRGSLHVMRPYRPAPRYRAVPYRGVYGPSRYARPYRSYRYRSPGAWRGGASRWTGTRGSYSTSRPSYRGTRSYGSGARSSSGGYRSSGGGRSGGRRR